GRGVAGGWVGRAKKAGRMRSGRCRSGPCSSTATFLPAFASTAANTEPDAPEPTMTTSTFSLAMSPPLGRRDVRHVRNAEAGIAFHGAIDDVDGVTAQDEVDERRARTLPALDLVLADAVDQAALLRFVELGKGAAAVGGLARFIDRGERGAIEVGVGRPHVEDARLEQRLFGRTRDLLIDEMGDAGLARPGNERLAQRIEGRSLRRCQRAQRHALRARRGGREQHLGAAHGEGERAEPRAFHQGASFDCFHAFLPIKAGHGALGRAAGLFLSLFIPTGSWASFAPASTPFVSPASRPTGRRVEAHSILPPNNRSALP